MRLRLAVVAEREGMGIGLHIVQYPMESLSPAFLARPPPRDADGHPHARPRVHSHPLRPRQSRVPKESVCGRALKKKVAMGRS